MRLGHAPQGAATVVMVDLGGLPGVLVDVEVTLGVDVPLARLQGRDHMPDAVQLVAGQVLVDVAGLDDFAVLDLRIVELVAVVGNVDFLLAFQLPVVAVRRTVVHVEVVRGAQAVGGGAGTVVGHLRSPPHAALAGVVEPRQARLLDLVEGLVDQQHVTGQARGRGDPLLEVEQHVARLVRVVVLQVGTEGEGILEVDQLVGAVDLRSGLGHQAPDAAAAIAGDVVPDHLQAVLRDRERVGGIEVLQAVAAFHQLGGGGVALGRLLHRRRDGGAAVGLVYRDLVGIRVALEHGQLAGSQLVLVLVDVLRGDGEQRLLAGIGVGEEATAVDAAGVGRQAAVPGGDAAVGVAFLLRADGGQAAAELGGLVGRNRRRHRTGQQAEGQRPGGQESCCFHASLSLFVSAKAAAPRGGGPQKFTPKLTARKSRSLIGL